MELVQGRIADGRVLKLIESFLKQQVMETTGWIEAKERDEGTPQGGVISPLLANIYLNPLAHLMSRSGYEMVRYADDMVMLCPNAEAAETVLQTLREWSAQAGLELHPQKTQMVDMGQPKAHFDFLGYRFWRGKTSGRIHRFIRPKSVQKFKAGIKPLSRRTCGQSLTALAQRLRPKLQGFYGYFKHVSAGTLREMDGWIRGRVRAILRKRVGLRGRGRGRDHQRWSNDYFTKLGFYNLEAARELEIISLRVAANN